MPDISLHNVVKNYGGETNAVESLDLQIDDGDFMCLLGPSGCGKTTTVRMIAGLETVTEGRLSIGDRVVDEPRASRFVSPRSATSDSSSRATHCGRTCRSRTTSPTG